MRSTLLLTACLSFAFSLRADDAMDLLRTVSDTYDSLATYEFSGTESVSLPGTGCTFDISIEVAAALPAYPPAIFFKSSKPSKACFDALTKVGSIANPGEWSHFGSINSGLKTVTELPQQILTLSGREIRCRVLEVLYDDYYQKLKSYDGPVRYWVDSQTHLLRRVEFTETTPQGPQFWTVTLETISTGGPAAYSLTSTSSPWETPSLLGKSAPNFESRTADGATMRLAELRGKLVVLDFWATWCGACVEEIPIMEKLQTDKALSGVALFGVTEENASDVRDWFSQYKRSFRTLVDAKTVFDGLGVKPIPMLVIIDRQGMVVEYNLGFHSEQQIRGLIAKHLSD